MAHKFICVRCGNGAIRHSRNNICHKCSFQRAEESKAATRQVVRLIRAGVMKKAKDCNCTDCGKPAFDYDHRDYVKPIEVQPVCRGCNQRRGLAFDSVMRPHKQPAKSV